MWRKGVKVNQRCMAAGVLNLTGLFLLQHHKSLRFSRGFFSPLDTTIWELFGFFFSKMHRFALGIFAISICTFSGCTSSVLLFRCWRKMIWHVKKGFHMWSQFSGSMYTIYVKKRFFPIWQCSIDCLKIAVGSLSLTSLLIIFIIAFWLFGGAVWNPAYL